MIKDATSWHHNPIDRRVMIPRPPYFTLSAGVRREHRDRLARERIAALAGL